jgi:hypothetical protein
LSRPLFDAPPSGAQPLQIVGDDQHNTPGRQFAGEPGKVMTPRREKIHVVVAVFAFGAILAGCGPTRPPDDRLAAAARELEAARAADAESLAAPGLRAAESDLARARAANVQGDFELAGHLAARAEVGAELAAAQARLARVRRAVETLQRENAALRRDLANDDGEDGP